MPIKRTKVTQLLLSAASLLVFCMPIGVTAHGDEASFEVPAGSYVADVGYDPNVFTAGYYTRFDFSLKTAKGEEGRPVPFDEVWVRIKDADNTYLATGIHKEPVGPTTLLYYFAAPGAYSLEASFRNANGDEVAAASFPITVSPSANAPRPYGYAFDALLVFLGIAFGAGGVWIWARYRKASGV